MREFDPMRDLPAKKFSDGALGKTTGEQTPITDADLELLDPEVRETYEAVTKLNLAKNHYGPEVRWWLVLGVIAALIASQKELTTANARLKELQNNIVPGPPCRWQVLKFAALMEKKLKQYDWKGGWHRCQSRTLIKYLRQEVDELESAAKPKPKTPEDITALANECGDVANFAMMIADNTNGIRYRK